MFHRLLSLMVFLLDDASDGAGGGEGDPAPETPPPAVDEAAAFGFKPPEGEGAGEGAGGEGQPPPNGEGEGEGAGAGGDGSPPPSDQDKSWEALARRDRELQERQARLREQETKLGQWENLQRMAQEDPIAAMRALNIDPYSVGDRLLGLDDKDGEGNKKGETYSAEQVQKMVSEQVQQHLHHQQQLQQHHQYIRNIIDRSDFELVKDEARGLPAPGQPSVVEQIFAEAGRRYRETGTPPDYNDLLREHEERLSTNLFAGIERAWQYRSVRQKFGELQAAGKKTPPPAAQEDPNKPQPATPRQSLSQDMKAEPSHEERPMTEAEKEAEFIRALKEGAPEGWKD